MQMFSRNTIEDILYHELDGVGNEECYIILVARHRAPCMLSNVCYKEICRYKVKKKLPDM